MIHHEIALAATIAALIAATWSAPNTIAVWAFAILFGMRLSSKFNIFLGVPNITESFLPEALGYLRSYFRRRPMNALWPFSVLAGAVLTAWLAAAALAPGADPFTVAGATLLFGLAALGVLEHLMLVLPLPDTALWRWAMPATAPDTRAPAEPPRPPLRRNADHGL